MKRPPDPRPGDPILADHIAYLYELADREVQVVPPLAKADDGAIYLADRPGFWIKLTGSPTGAKHPWTEQTAASGGTWADAVATGSATLDPAYEINGSTATLTGKVVRAWRDRAAGEVRFAYGACS